MDKAAEAREHLVSVWGSVLGKLKTEAYVSEEVEEGGLRGGYSRFVVRIITVR